MDARREALKREKDQLLQRLAELQVAEQRLDGLFDAVPHYSRLEKAGRELGQAVSRATQERLSREVAAEAQATACCPACQHAAPITTKKRTVTGLDGPVELLEPVAYCSVCRRDFFPSACRVGIGQP